MNDGFQYAWIDTCCIDKDSSAELSESINSMYKWYEKAAICYAFLADFQSHEVSQLDDLGGCKWFYRGWTLQELLAPKEIVFYGQKWDHIGTKSTMLEKLQQITGIPMGILLRRRGLDTVSVAARMSWAAHRETTRIEDAAYCLLGIFDVNMPLLYGEGEKAFVRLQSEIMNQTQDDSLFAWCADTRSVERLPYRGLYAKSPKEFAGCGDIQSLSIDNNNATTFFGNGRISLNCGMEIQDDKILVAIKCYRQSIFNPIAVEVSRIGSKTFLRSTPCSLFSVPLRPFDQEIIVERYAERQQLLLIPDVHQDGSIYLGDLPDNMLLHSTIPQGFRSSNGKRITAADAIEAKKVAFHVGFCGSYLRNKSLPDFAPVSDRPHKVLLIFWVSQSSAGAPYRYLFDVVTIPMFPSLDLDSWVEPESWAEWERVEYQTRLEVFFHGAGTPRDLSDHSITMGDLKLHFIPGKRVIEGHEVMYIESRVEEAAISPE